MVLVCTSFTFALMMAEALKCHKKTFKLVIDHLTGSRRIAAVEDWEQG